jgi:hypothetical protein
MLRVPQERTSVRNRAPIRLMPHWGLLDPSLSAYRNARLCNRSALSRTSSEQDATVVLDQRIDLAIDQV